MPPAGSVAPQGNPRTPYTRDEYYPPGPQEREIVLNSIIDSTEEDTEILEPAARELLAATPPLGLG